jgi:hypothetical protein
VRRVDTRAQEWVGISNHMADDDRNNSTPRQGDRPVLVPLHKVADY